MEFNLSINDATLLSLSDINILGTPSFYCFCICCFFDYLNFYFEANGNTFYNVFGIIKGANDFGFLSMFL
jgi:hypothetical protein